MQYFSVVLFNTLYKVVLTFESVIRNLDILQRDFRGSFPVLSWSGLGCEIIVFVF